MEGDTWGVILDCIFPKASRTFAFIASSPSENVFQNQQMVHSWHYALHNFSPYSICQTIQKVLPYSRKFWRELNLVDWPQPAWIKISVDFNLAVRYGIAIRIYATKNFWWILIWWLQRWTTKPPNLIPHQIFILHMNFLAAILLFYFAIVSFLLSTSWRIKSTVIIARILLLMPIILFRYCTMFKVCRNNLKLWGGLEHRIETLVR